MLHHCPLLNFADAHLLGQDNYVLVIVLDIIPALPDVFSHVLSLSFLTMVLYQKVIYLFAYFVCQ